MRRQINHYLDRARIAAQTDVIGVVTEVEPVVDRLVRVMSRLHDERGIKLISDIPDQARFKGEQQDLEEIVGNLVDNACKWARDQGCGRRRPTSRRTAATSPGSLRSASTTMGRA